MILDGALIPLTYLAAVVLSTLVLQGRDLLAARRQRQAADAALARLFRAAAHELDLRHEDGDPSRGVSLAGRSDGYDLRATCGRDAPHGWLTTVSVTLPRAPAWDLRLRSPWQHATSGAAPTVETGDVSFDSLVKVGASEPVARAFLGHKLRHAVSVLARRGVVSFREGVLSLQVHARPATQGELVSLLTKVSEAARAFPDVSDLVAAVAESARTDSNASVRERCLATLLREAPDDARTAAALDTALADPSDCVRLVAATALGERGVPILREIARRAEGEPDVVARAIALLGEQLTQPDLISILDGAGDSRRYPVAAAAVRSLGRSGGSVAHRRLQGLLLGRNRTLAADAAEALAATPKGAVEQLLVDALPYPNAEVQRAIVRALARVGSVGTMAHLRALLARQRTAFAATDADRELAAACEEAIAAIQARLPGAAAGQVSLADVSSGDLSLSDQDAGGRLSLPRKPVAE